MKISRLIGIFGLILLGLMLTYISILAYFFLSLRQSYQQHRWSRARAQAYYIYDILKPLKPIPGIGKIPQFTAKLLPAFDFLDITQRYTKAVMRDTAEDPIKLYSQLLIVYKKIDFNFIKTIVNNEHFPDYDFDLNQICDNQNLIAQALQFFPEIFGFNQKKVYTVLLQNNKELRPSGGFMGSFAQFAFEKGRLSQQLVQDIYVPDGAIDGHIDAPTALQTAFGHGTWKLRDSNFDPDFSKTAQIVDWFLQRGGVAKSDGIIAVNLESVEQMLNLIGPVHVPDYQVDIDSSNLYELAQSEAESNFFPGSTAKKDFLQQAEIQLQAKLLQLSFTDYLKLGQAIQQQLEQKNIQMYFKNPDLNKTISNLNWGGEIRWSQDINKINDYLYINEANLSANKANCCIERELKRKITLFADRIEIQDQFTLTNNNIDSRPNPPEVWGGDYRVFIRFHIPSQATEVNLFTEEKDFSQNEVEISAIADKNITSHGIMITVPHQQSKKIYLNYSLPFNKTSGYTLAIQKQSGVPAYFVSLDFVAGNQTQYTKRSIESDQQISFTFMYNKLIAK